ncbi:MAG: PSD1 and planctomycete cytochrome C domain-containing protein [Haloferula sp.]
MHALKTSLAAGMCLGLTGVVQGEQEGISFNESIRPILSNACYACHGPDEEERKGDLRLDTREGAMEDLGKGFHAVVPGDPDKSELIYRILSDDEDEVMPPADFGKRLTEEEIELLKRWVEQGAPYEKHWSYQAPKRPAVPASDERSVIDFFVQQRLKAEQLEPSPEAERRVIARRVALDLTGLPLTAEEADTFAEDDSDDAYEKLVDGLLERPTFGEHWARMWLDLARYADSAGYADDPVRTIWAFRDYVIRSFNENKRFDQFTIEQLAGDLLPNPSQEVLVATAFHRNTQTNSEGGTDDEEYRNVAVVDRVNTTGQVWLGTTLACAQCHTHKYDPITHEDYFRMFAIFNNTEDSDKKNEQPILELMSDEQRRLRDQRAGKLAELENELKHPDEAYHERFKAWVESQRSGQSGDKLPDKLADLLAKENRNGGEEKRLRDFYNKHDPWAKEQLGRIAEAKKLLDAARPATTVPIMRELAEGRRRKTHIQIRGNFLDHGKEVGPGFPEALHQAPADEDLDRLALAKWIVDPAHPLTSRVIVNRFWEKIFGVGLVATSEEFGSQGEPPSHPELLDWLALEFIDSGWDVKALLKQMVMSATYRQDSTVTAGMAERDPDNRLLARGPRFRLTAEMVRDQSLLIAGLLSSKMYGAPVQPPQPELGVKVAFGGGVDWKTSAGEDRYRRGLYTRWRRSNPYPSMVAFDAPTREVCAVRRDRTNTPLQAFVTLNDPVFIEAAQGLARRMAEDESEVVERVRRGYQLCFGRLPGEAELERLLTLYQTAHEQYSAAPADAEKLATDPLGPIPDGSDAIELAALTVVGNVLLNLDEMLMKR